MKFDDQIQIKKGLKFLEEKHDFTPSFQPNKSYKAEYKYSNEITKQKAERETLKSKLEREHFER